MQVQAQYPGRRNIAGSQGESQRPPGNRGACGGLLRVFQRSPAHGPGRGHQPHHPWGGISRYTFILAKGETMTDNKRIEILEKSLARHLEWIRAADIKASIALTIDLALILVVSTRLESISNLSWIWVLIVGTTTILWIVSVGFICSSFFFPRCKGRKTHLSSSDQSAGSLLRSIGTLCSNLMKKAYIEDLIAQCHRNAQIANSKYWKIKWAMHSLFASLLLWLIILFGLR